MDRSVLDVFQPPETDGYLVVLVGAAGSERSDWAERRFNQTQIVSEDVLRGMVGDDSLDPKTRTPGVDLLERIVDIRLDRRLVTVIDSVGLDKSQRIRWLKKAQDRQLLAFAILFETDVQACVDRNSTRDRPLPATIVRRQAERCLEIADTIEEEGFILTRLAS